MAIRKDQMSIREQARLIMLSKADQEEVLNCETMEEAKRLLSEKEEAIHFKESYEPKIEISGSLIKYKTKQLFTEEFDEQDVKEFMSIAELSATMEDEIIINELTRKINLMIKKGKQPVQCMVYATKNNEKTFYNNEKKVMLWAKVIADTVNDNPEYVEGINHMLVNWSLWKYQVTLLIAACGSIKCNDTTEGDNKLDKVIRELYTKYDDDKVRYTVIRRLLNGLNKENYQSAFLMLKNADFIGSDIDRKYFNIVKRKVENATLEEKEALYEAFRGVQGYGGAKRKRVEALFIKKEETGIVKKINESSSRQKEALLKEVHNKIYGSQKEYREVALQARNIKMYRPEIQEMFMQKMDKNDISLEEVKVYGLAIGNFDEDNRALPFLEEQMSLYMDDAKKLMFLYVMAVLSDDYIDRFIKLVLAYDGSDVHTVLNSVKNLIRQGKNVLVRKYLYENCAQIRDNHGIDSNKFKVAFRNIGEFLQEGHCVAVYDIKFDSLIFEFVGYDKENRSFENTRCTFRNVAVVLEILEKVMDKNNYEGRYMKFMWDLFNHFKKSNIDLATRIDTIVKDLNGEGIPSL